MLRCAESLQPHVVDLNNPERVVMVQVVKSCAALSVLSDYYALCKYNVRTLVTPPDARAGGGGAKGSGVSKPKAAAAEGGAAKEEEGKAAEAAPAVEAEAKAAQAAPEAAAAAEAEKAAA
jgi:hypothetical protein